MWASWFPPLLRRGQLYNERQVVIDGGNTIKETMRE